MDRKHTLYATALLALFLLAGIKPAWASQIAAGSEFTMALMSDGSLSTWGNDSSGQLGNGTTGGTTTTTPTQVGTATTWSAVSAGSDFAAAIASDNTLWTWGDNTNGQLGSGTTTSRNAPGQIVPAMTWSTVSAGSNFMVGISSSDGSLWSWGSNTSGQLGQTPANPSVPTQVGTATWSAVCAGSNFVVAIRSDGTLWSWGDNTYGELGNSTTGGTTTTPTQVGTATTWSAVSAGSGFVVALQSNGTLWTWGNGLIGQLGNGSNTSTNAPGQIGTSLTSSGIIFTAVTAGNDFALALASTGVLYSWGDNTNGRLGIGTTGGSATTPTLVSSSEKWTAVTAGSNFAVATATDGSLWAWGNNDSYQLGDGLTTSQVSPEEIISSGLSVFINIVATVPVSGATEVEVDKPISVTFATAMDPTTITTSTFFLTPPVAGTISYDSTTDTATFTPNDDLHASTNYTATVTTGAMDLSGNHLATNYNWAFQTENKHTYSCFIATAAYGSYLDPHVAALRAFRDDYLLKTWAGRVFVSLYYRFSPPAARIIARHATLRMITRWFLTPLVYGLAYPFALIFGLPLLLAAFFIGKGTRKRKARG